MNSVQQAALAYIDAGLAPIPIPFKKKKVVITGWPTLRIKKEDIAQYFPPDKQMNLGVLNGEPSGGTIDLDLDCQAAIALASYFMPASITFGRQSKPESHWIYKATANLPGTMQFLAAKSDGKEKMILEVRSNGTQTVFPPSVHESGEAISFTSAEQNLCEIDGKELVSQAKRLAAASVLLESYPAKGARQHFALAISGTLLQNDWNIDDAKHFISAIATANGDEELAKRIDTVDQTYTALSKGKAVSGFAKLSSFLPHVKSQAKLTHWLDLKSQVKTATKTSPPPEGNSPFAEITVPDNYKLTSAGLFCENRNGWEKIAGPIAVTALTFDYTGGNHGLKIVYINKIGIGHEIYTSANVIAQQNSPLVVDLLDKGFQLLPGDERKLQRYLASSTPSTILRCVSKLGWTKQGGFAFVDCVLTHNGSEEVIYQPEKNSPTVATIHENGTLYEWKENIALPLIGNPIPMFTICFALASPLLELVGLDSGGIHLVGETSKGKTTVLQIATSTIGNASDPSASAENTAIRTWNTTANGLEGICAAYNNLPLPLDEAGKCNAHDFGKVVYDICGGQGKSALSSDRSLKKIRVWSTHIISTGEVSSRSKIEEKGQAKAGQLIRLIDIEVPNVGLFINTGSISGGQFARKLKKDCGKYYGTAMPAFIQSLLARYPTPEVLTDALMSLQNQYYQVLINKYRPTDEKARVALRFAITRVAGELAVNIGVLPYTSQQIDDAVDYVFDLWLKGTEEVSENVRAIKKIADFIMGSLKRFYKIASNDPEQEFPNQMAGYHKPAGHGQSSKFQEEFFLFTPGGFAEACRGFEINQVCKALEDSCFLVRDADQIKTRHTVPINNGNKTMRLYAVRADILQYDPKALDEANDNLFNLT